MYPVHPNALLYCYSHNQLRVSRDELLDDISLVRDSIYRLQALRDLGGSQSGSRAEAEVEELAGDDVGFETVVSKTSRVVDTRSSRVAREHTPHEATSDAYDSVRDDVGDCANSFDLFPMCIDDRIASSSDLVRTHASLPLPHPSLYPSYDGMRDSIDNSSVSSVDYSVVNAEITPFIASLQVAHLTLNASSDFV